MYYKAPLFEKRYVLLEYIQKMYRNDDDEYSAFYM